MRNFRTICLYVFFVMLLCSACGDSGSGGGGLGSGMFVAVGEGAVVTSRDGGVTWERSAPCQADELYEIVYGNGIYLATGADYDATGFRAWYSSDGTNWLETYPSISQLGTSMYGNGMFIVVHSGSGAMQTSTDCVTWTSPVTKFAGMEPVDGICVNGTFYLVCADETTGDLTVFTSTDADTWTQHDVPAIQVVLGGMCYGNGYFILVVSDGNIYRSTNGTDWSGNLGPGANIYFNNVTCGDGTFVASGPDAKIYISTDNGATWDQTTPNNLPGIQGGAYGAGKFVLVGGGLDVWTSSTGELGTWSKVFDPATSDYLYEVVYVE